PRPFSFPACTPRVSSKQLRNKTVDLTAISPKTYEWAFRENGRLLNATVILSVNPTEADYNLAVDVLNSLQVGPPPTGTEPPIVKPGQSPFCAAVDDFRTAGLMDESGTIKSEALPYFERMRAVAPSDSQPPLDVIIEWLR